MLQLGGSQTKKVEHQGTEKDLRDSAIEWMSGIPQNSCVEI